MNKLAALIAVCLTLLIIACLVVGAISGFNDVIKTALGSLIGVFVGLGLPQLKLSLSGESDSPDSAPQ